MREEPLPSTKKGRFSWKEVSNGERLRTAGSASTWPKSGCTVAFSVRSDVMPYLRSAPRFWNPSILSSLPGSEIIARSVPRWTT